MRNDVTMDGVERDGTQRSSAIAARSSPLGVVPLARLDRDRVLVEALRRREPTAAERLIIAHAAAGDAVVPVPGALCLGPRRVVVGRPEARALGAYLLSLRQLEVRE